MKAACRPAPIASAVLLALLLAWPIGAEGQSISISPPDSFAQGSQDGVVTYTPTGPQGGIEIRNELNGANGTLDVTVTAAASVSGVAGLYVLQGFGTMDTQDGTVPGPYVNGPTLSATNSASLALSDAALATGQQTAAAIAAISFGAPGYAQQKDGALAAIYNAGYGGTVSLTNNGSIEVSGSTTNGGPGEPWIPFLTALSAFSGGGQGAAAKADDDDFAGNGGNGGVISVTTGAGSIINLQGSVPGGSFINGITAWSQGGLPGALTSGDHPNTYGASGTGGAVTVSHGGSIIGDATNAIGIVAVSIGGAGGTIPGGGVGNAPGTSGSGGAVTVALASGAAINLAAGNTIGIYAASAVGASDSDFAGYPVSGGPVTVTIDAGALVSTGNAAQGGGAGGRFGVGVLAISAGTASALDPFSVSAVSLSGSGYSGAVQVGNAGTILTSGELAVGIAALSVGGASIATNAAGGQLSYLGSTATNPQYARGGSVSVGNSGLIATNGASAFGILAVSSGAGGLIGTDSGATFAGNAATSGVVLGTLGYTGNSSPGGTVQVGNSGSITTGDGQGGGVLGIGIVAQSIGGGGGSSGGQGAAAFLGDAGGNGGNGGAVTVENTGTVITRDDGAIGILAQSVGGGGGQGGNAGGIFVAVGGQGGEGGAGGPVTVSLPAVNGVAVGTVTTMGDFAAGVIAQSIGGGGGSGGFGTSAGLFASVAIGGAGGSGGNGGEVTFANTATLSTSGQNSLGLLAQSVGGGGGNGGAATSVAAGIGFVTTIAIGGTAGNGGSGGTVSVNNNYHITTTGPDAIGLVAQSIGGGGGTGGASTAKSLAVSVPDVPTFSFTASVGGSGSGGGGGGGVTINNAGRIITLGHGAHGLLAQSIGGGGGNGGDSTATSRALPVGAATAQLTLALGATGGLGGDGGPVTVISGDSGTCTPCASWTETGGNGAAGLAAQSIGGGGGNSTAGNATSDQANIGNDLTGTTFALSIGLGASGGAGGSGGTVQVTLDAGNTILTRGSGSPGILAQSIGGGGGASSGGSFGLVSPSPAGNIMPGTVQPTVAVGGVGVPSSGGGQVTVSNAGTITTRGGDSIGILAQSIAGGGGLAGSSDAAASVTPSNQVENALAPSSTATYDAEVSVGGKGGAGGDGGMVGVTHTGSITTLGIRAYGIEAQSVGGGGGQGGTATSTAQGTSSATYSANVSVGGNGGAAGNGGQVSVSSAGPIATAGYAAHGILAHSIGGGGGAGADGSVGANTTLSLGAGVNGKGGGSGTGGNVSVSTLAGGTIRTWGDDAAGVLAQSIGGGGGTATAGCTNSGGAGATACFGNTGVSASTTGPVAFLPSSSLNITVGGNSAGGGNGDNATVGVADSIVTSGARAMGVVAQSIGGGGGYAPGSGATLSATTVAGSPGANAGTGGPVTVTVAATGSIATSGAGAWGILAQSVGGGGGFAGDPSLALVTPVSNTLPRSGSGNAFANTVAVNVEGSVTTTGANAHGVVAQSLGGSGGIVGGCCLSPTANLLIGNTAQYRGTSNATYWGDGGAVTITQGAGSTIAATGPGAIAILAQSTGNDAAVNAINVTIGGVVQGGTNGGQPVPSGLAGAAGILLSGGGATASNPNTITVQAGGSVGTVDGLAGTAILATSGLTNVANSGTITGAILLGATPGTVTNATGGTLNLGGSVVATALVNDGTVVVQPGTTGISGGFTQNAGGTTTFAFDGVSNHTLAVAGTASLGGSVVPVVTTALLPFTDTILTAGGGLAALTATGPQTLLFGWTLQATGHAVTIAPVADFTPAGVALDASQTSLANYLGRAWANGDPSFAGRFAALYTNVSSGAAYTAALDQYSPRAIQGPAQAMLNGSGAMLGASLSCPRFEGAGTLLGEATCLWARGGGQVTHQYREGGTVSGATYRIGGQKQVAPGWFLGGSLAGGSVWAEAGGGSKVSGETYDGSLAVKHVAGPWLVGGSLALGGGTYRNSRVIGAPGGGVARSDSHALLAGGRFRAAYDLAFESWYLRPFLDLDLYHLRTPGFTESGGGGNALQLRASGTTRAAVSPMLEIGARHDLGPATVLRWYVDVGASFLPGTSRTVEASFVGAAPEDGTFATVLKSPAVTANLDLGVQLYEVGGWELRAEYNLRAASAFLSQGGSLRVGTQF